MSYSVGFEKNVNDIMLYFGSCDLPKFDKLASLRARKVNPCPICCSPSRVDFNNVCAGHGEYYHYYVIRCSSCGLSLRFREDNDILLWNRLSFNKD